MQNKLHVLRRAQESRPVSPTDRNRRALPHGKAFTGRSAPLPPPWTLVHRGAATGAIRRCSAAAGGAGGPCHRQSGHRASTTDISGWPWSNGGAYTVRTELRARLARKVNVCIPRAFATSPSSPGRPGMADLLHSRSRPMLMVHLPHQAGFSSSMPEERGAAQ